MRAQILILTVSLAMLSASAAAAEPARRMPLLYAPGLKSQVAARTQFKLTRRFPDACYQKAGAKWEPRLDLPKQLPFGGVELRCNNIWLYDMRRCGAVGGSPSGRALLKQQAIGKIACPTAYKANFADPNAIGTFPVCELVGEKEVSTQVENLPGGVTLVHATKTCVYEGPKEMLIQAPDPGLNELPNLTPNVCRYPSPGFGGCYYTRRR